MKIVIAAPRFPYPLDKGDRLTIFHMLKYFSRHHEISFVCFLEEDQELAWAEKIRPFCHQLEIVPLKKWRAYVNCARGLATPKPLQMHYYSDPQMVKAVKSIVDKVNPDLLYAHTIRMGQYLIPHNRYPTVLAMQIAMTLNYKRLVERTDNGLQKLFYSIEYQKVRRYEAKFAHQFDRVLLISQHDLDALEDPPYEKVFLNPHGVDFNYFAPDPDVSKEANSLIITGNMNYEPNVDAVTYFCTEVLPHIRQAVPDVTLKIVGADPRPEVFALHNEPMVSVTGRVADLRPYMNQAQVAVAPLQVGAGLQNKVLEGMSMGLPMVITSVANEGIQAIDCENVLIADHAPAFADSVVTLLQNAERRRQLGSAARKFIVEQWSWDKHFGDLESMFETLVEQHAVVSH